MLKKKIINALNYERQNGMVSCLCSAKLLFNLEAYHKKHNQLSNDYYWEMENLFTQILSIKIFEKNKNKEKSFSLDLMVQPVEY